MDFSEVPFGDRFSQALRPRTVIAGVAALATVVACIVGAGAVTGSADFTIERASASETVSDAAAEGAPGGADSVETPSEPVEGSAEANQPSEVYVHVGGHVKAPGLYCLPVASRVADAVEAAGGFDGEADADALNLAQPVQDGDRIIVPAVGEQPVAAPAQSGESGSNQSEAAGNTSTLININTADAAALQTLSGIGESTAKKIVADREKNGPFASKEDIKRVSGIGDKKYEAICDFICI